MPDKISIFLEIKCINFTYVQEFVSKILYTELFEEHLDVYNFSD